MGILGILWSFSIDVLYGVVILSGLLIDIVIYTIWLKRRSAWSIVWGGIAGGMPILAGRVLAVGSIDWVGITLALAVLFWIPTHIMTFNIRYKKDYAKAGVPTFPNVYSDQFANTLVVLSSVVAAIAMGFSAYGLGASWGSLRVIVVLSIGLFALAISSLMKPSFRVNFGLFKYASVYMLSSMVLVVVEAI
jgi:protoheme IX farnesyltransferase